MHRLRQHLLARPRFALDQHLRSGHRYLAGTLYKELQFGRLARLQATGRDFVTAVIVAKQTVLFCELSLRAFVEFRIARQSKR
jgi:hypothetical protein